MSRPVPPDDRLDGPVHEFFGLSYSNYLVLHRTLMQSMPVDWQQRMVGCVEELDAAFEHAEKADTYEVRPAKERYYRELSEAEMQRLGVTGEWDRDEPWPDRFYSKDGTEYGPDDRLLVPYGDDPVPHYDRGRAYVEPHIEPANDQPGMSAGMGSVPSSVPIVQAGLGMGFPLVRGHCPMGCGETLFLGSGGYPTCSFAGCPRPDAVSTLLADGESQHIVELGDDGCTVRHPLRERLDDALMSCVLLADILKAGRRRQPGRYRVTEVAAPARWRWSRLPAPEVSDAT